MITVSSVKLSSHSIHLCFGFPAHYVIAVKLFMTVVSVQIDSSIHFSVTLTVLSKLQQRQSQTVLNEQILGNF